MPTLNRSYGSTVQNGKANGQDDGQGARSSQDKPGLEPRNQSLGAVWKRRWCSWWNSTWKLSLDMIWSFGRSCSSSKLPCWSIMFLYPEPAAGIAELQDGGDGIQEVESQPRPPGPRQKYVTGFGSIYFPFFAWQLETTTLYHSEVSRNN